MNNNELLYRNKKVYGPYTRKDGRQVVVLKTPGSNKDHQTVSYPKYLVERALGRYLDEDEQIDHIDGNIYNNDFSNLRIVPHPKHARSHVLQRIPEEYTCPICGSIYYVTSSEFKKTCSKHCAGVLSHYPNLSASIFEKPRRYKSLRSEINDYLTVEEMLNSKLN